MSPHRTASIMLAFGLIVGIPGCFVLFPLDEYQDGVSPVDASVQDATMPSDAGSDAAPPDAALNDRLIFVTGATFTGSLEAPTSADGGPPLTGAPAGDVLCTDLARRAGRVGNFKALLSDSNAPAKSRITDDTSKPARPIVDSTGRRVAPTITGLFQNGPSVALDRTESGDALSLTGSACGGAGASIVWTGSNATGGRADTNPCNNWKSNASGANTQVGATVAGTKWLSAGCSVSCNNQAHLYCLQE